MLIIMTTLRQVLTGLAIFVLTLVLLALIQIILAPPNTATGLGYIKGFYPLFLSIGVLWLALAMVVRLLI